MAKQCNECLFTKRKIVSDERRDDVLESCRREDKHFVCHKSPRGRPICCRGFFERSESTSTQLAQRLGIVDFIRLEADHE